MSVSRIQPIMLPMTRKANSWLGWIVLVVLAAGVGTGTFRWAMAQADPEPLGVPVPKVDAAYELLPAERTGEASVINRQLPESMLELLVEQPDGSPPLRYGISCDIGDFSIRHHYGAQTRAYSYEEVKLDGTLIEGDMMFDHPLRYFKYSAIQRKDKETAAEHAARLHDNLAQEGAKFHPDTTPLEIDGYRFEHFEYDLARESEELITHFLFIGPLGPNRVLVMNFMTVPELHGRTAPAVWKIMRSFVPGWELQELTIAERDGISSELPAADVAGE